MILTKKVDQTLELNLKLEMDDSAGRGAYEDIQGGEEFLFNEEDNDHSFLKVIEKVEDEGIDGHCVTDVIVFK